jgi:hypothetical protein
MLPNISEQLQLTETQITVPPTANAPSLQPGQLPTPYDYLTLLPGLIVAATPLILGLKKKQNNKDDDKEDND